MNTHSNVLAGVALVAVLAALGLQGCGSDSTSEEGDASKRTQADLCAKFCADEETTCTDALYPYADDADCLSSCKSYARGEVGATSGNTLDCRIYHLDAAATMSAMVHCPHTAAEPTAFCVAPK